MTKYENEEFNNKIFAIEECFFVNCVLRNCDLFYSGGDAEWINVQMENCRWHFRGQALRTVQFLHQIGMLPGPQSPAAFPSSGSNVN